MTCSELRTQGGAPSSAPCPVDASPRSSRVLFLRPEIDTRCSVSTSVSGRILVRPMHEGMMHVWMWTLWSGPSGQQPYHSSTMAYLGCQSNIHLVVLCIRRWHSPEPSFRASLHPYDKPASTHPGRLSFYRANWSSVDDTFLSFLFQLLPSLPPPFR